MNKRLKVSGMSAMKTNTEMMTLTQTCKSHLSLSRWAVQEGEMHNRCILKQAHSPCTPYHLLPSCAAILESGVILQFCSQARRIHKYNTIRASVQILRVVRGCKTQILKFCYHPWCFKVVNGYYSQSWYKLRKSNIQVLFPGDIIPRY